VVIGASVEEAGFSTAVRAGAVFELLEAAVAVVPAVAELELVETLSRLRPGSPDNLPILGTTSVPGLVLATGHYRNGVLLTPITAEAITAVLCGHELPAVAAPFTLARFT
jgi:glycine oxidase